MKDLYNRLERLLLTLDVLFHLRNFFFLEQFKELVEIRHALLLRQIKSQMRQKQSFVSHTWFLPYDERFWPHKLVAFKTFKTRFLLTFCFADENETLGLKKARHEIYTEKINVFLQRAFDDQRSSKLNDRRSSKQFMVDGLLNVSWLTIHDRRFWKRDRDTRQYLRSMIHGLERVSWSTIVIFQKTNDLRSLYFCTIDDLRSLVL